VGNEDFDDEDSYFDEEAPDEDDEEAKPQEPKVLSRVPTKKRGPAFLNKGPRKHVKMMFETETERETQKDVDF
jgi:hypothetical protein